MLKVTGVVLTAVVSAVLTGEAMLHAPELSRFLGGAPQQAEMAVAAPATAQADGAEHPAAVVSKARDGHYWAWADVDGHAVRVLIDTGATAVALTPDDARRAGVDLEQLVYNHPVATAHGPILAGDVTLERVSIAGAEVRKVQALVVPKGLSASLLGMSYLGRLERFEASRNTMTLQP